MTSNQHVHELVDELPDDSPLLIEVRETLRMNQALREAIADVAFASAKFMAKVQERWPRQTCNSPA
jgi:hypothetical protein